MMCKYVVDLNGKSRQSYIKFAKTPDRFHCSRPNACSHTEQLLFLFMSAASRWLLLHSTNPAVVEEVMGKPKIILEVAAA